MPASTVRSIVGFYPDPAGDWVAELSCYHNQHIRHRPPFQERAWVLDPVARAGRVGSPIECPLCDRAEFPEGLTLVARAGPWDQDSLPRGLLRAHRTAEGRWGRLRVLDGAVDFQFEGDCPPAGLVVRLAAGSHQDIPPGAPHRLLPIGAVRFELELWGHEPEATAGLRPGPAR